MQLVTAALLLHEGNVLLAQRPAGDRLALKWEFPGGKVEEGETPEDCLKRELHEEAGVTWQAPLPQTIRRTTRHHLHLAG